MLSAIVIDDEPLACEELCELLAETSAIKVLGQAANAIEGLDMIQQHKPDVIFLDIEMPQISGLELLAMLDVDTMPYVVLVTAFEQYAIQAFEDNAFDYILKPVEPARLNKTIARLQKRSQPQAPLETITPATLTHIPCSGHQRVLIIPEADIEVAFSDLAGVHIKTAQQQADTQLTLKTLEQKTSLVRCHRQYLVRMSAISEIKLLENGLGTIFTHSGEKIPVSRRYLKKLKESFHLNRQ
ncbi:two-component system response regulator BtsR [Alteromonas sp. C1M14]|uniref:two-component system response regulator BtsR n=1 Tax=Alteromonas sp. C1M14 TaxID=2841567 RepID=UPI001C0A01D5|nr:two-component system response regulator BtsR [Alteromonas sp. C1M14]MBU2979539.1 two-component system response regulator BtsR [Alteromonas sp. C1M14]